MHAPLNGSPYLHFKYRSKPFMRGGGLIESHQSIYRHIVSSVTTRLYNRRDYGTTKNIDNGRYWQNKRLLLSWCTFRCTSYKRSSLEAVWLVCDGQRAQSLGRLESAEYYLWFRFMLGEHDFGFSSIDYTPGRSIMRSCLRWSVDVVKWCNV